MPERFRLADAVAWIPEHRLHDAQHSQRHLPVRLHPPPQIIPEILIEVAFPTLPAPLFLAAFRFLNDRLMGDRGRRDRGRMRALEAAKFRKDSALHR